MTPLLDDKRWAIYIDIEGFGARWEEGDDALRALGELMRGIVRIGRKCFPDEVDRLFAHQFGDGFIIVSDFEEKSLERCAAIAITLMRYVLGHNAVARASIAEGHLADIKNCYPKEVFEDIRDDDTVYLGAGLMTIIPVMGSALTRAVAIDKRSPRGPLLMIADTETHRLGEIAQFTLLGDGGVSLIDWVHASSQILDRIATATGLMLPETHILETLVAKYCVEQELKTEWKGGVRKFLKVSI